MSLGLSENSAWPGPETYLKIRHLDFTHSGRQKGKRGIQQKEKAGMKKGGDLKSMMKVKRNHN
jgi:hypothetical protein